MLRGPGRRRERLVEDWGPYETGEPEDADAGEPFEHADLTPEIWRLVGQLSPRQRELIRVLYEPERPSYADVSVRMAMPVGAIGPTRQRALRRLRELVEAMSLVPA
jgi:DNA-directed RNA polymerase specialized sigma24 family protein